MNRSQLIGIGILLVALGISVIYGLVQTMGYRNSVKQAVAYQELYNNVRRDFEEARHEAEGCKEELRQCQAGK